MCLSFDKSVLKLWEAVAYSVLSDSARQMRKLDFKFLIKLLEVSLISVIWNLGYKQMALDSGEQDVCQKSCCTIPSLIQLVLFRLLEVVCSIPALYWSEELLN